MFKNNAECSLFELLCDLFSKNFQSSMLILCAAMAHVTFLYGNDETEFSKKLRLS